MKVVVASHTTDVFATSGEDDVAGALQAALREAGHQVHPIWQPFDASPDSVLSQLALVRMIDLLYLADLVICTTAVAGLIQHPRKVLWADSLLEDLSPRFGEIDARLLAEMDVVYARSGPASDRIAVRAGRPCPVLAVPDERDAWAAAADRLVSR